MWFTCKKIYCFWKKKTSFWRHQDSLTCINTYMLYIIINTYMYKIVCDRAGRSLECIRCCYIGREIKGKWLFGYLFSSNSDLGKLVFMLFVTEEMRVVQPWMEGHSWNLGTIVSSQNAKSEPVFCLHKVGKPPPPPSLTWWLKHLLPWSFPSLEFLPWVYFLGLLLYLAKQTSVHSNSFLIFYPERY